MYKNPPMKISQSNKLVIEVTILLSIATILFALDQGFTINIIKGTLVCAFLILFLYVDSLFTETRIENYKTLTNKAFLSFGFKTDIKNITKIDRGYQFIFKNWGCRLEVHYLDEYNMEQVKGIQESIYNIEDIQALLKTLKEINPKIKLHPHYQDLIDGKTKDLRRFKKMRP